MSEPAEPSKSWRQAAQEVDLGPRSNYPAVREFERSVLPTVRTQRASYDTVICSDCSRPMIAHLLPEHQKECPALTKRQSKPVSVQETAPPLKAEPNGDLADDVAAKKRKRDPLDDDKSKKRVKAKPKQAKQQKPTKSAKPAKEKANQVYNPDRNCGVTLPNGQPCMRSLTCKQHPMGAKRAVPGRSMQYDLLLTSYHRQHQMKQAQQSAQAANAAQTQFEELQDAQIHENPEKEFQQCLEGVRRVYCPPLATGHIDRTAFRCRQFRLREMLSMSLMPKKLPPSGDLLYGRSLAFRPDSPGDYVYLRSQAMQQTYYFSQLQQQRQQQQRRQQQLLSKDPKMVNIDKDRDPEQSARMMAQQRIKSEMARSK